MKIEQKKSFSPVVITLETAEELDYVVMNLGATTKDDVRRCFSDSRHVDQITSAYDFGYQLYVQLKEKQQ